MADLSDRSGLSRRDMLKRGAIVGGVAIWMTPAFQVLGVGQRHAQAASNPPPPRKDEKVKDEKDNDEKDKDEKDKKK